MLNHGGLYFVTFPSVIYTALNNLIIPTKWRNLHANTNENPETQLQIKTKMYLEYGK
jgi:hypothetical protein